MPSTALLGTGLESRIEVLENLRGQIIHVKGLGSAFSAWPFKVNQHVDQVRKDVTKRLNSLFPHHPKLRKLNAADYGLFGATWWPCASLTRLRIATFLSIWLFMWDDEIDLDDGNYWLDPELAQNYREETLKFVRSHLGLDDAVNAFISGNTVIDSFDVIGEALQESFSVEQREKFMSELAFFIEKSEVEQRLRLQVQIATVKDFWQYRLGTSAVRVVLCLNEYCNETALPSHLMRDLGMAALWDLTNANICNVNDLLSVKKEIAQGSVESLIPILYSTRRDAQVVADEVMENVHFTVAEFDAVAKRLVERCKEHESVEAAKMLVAFVEGCRYYCTGNLSWSLSTGRYGVHQELGQNEIVIKL